MHRDDEVGGVGARQRRAGRCGPVGHQPHLNPGRLASEADGERWHQHELGDVGHRDGERTVAARRLEGRAGAERPRELVERPADGRGQLAGAGRGREAAALAHEQRITDRVSQASERVAHRGLAQADAACGGGHAALAEERVEDHEQVEVEAGKIHHVNVGDSNNPFLEFDARWQVAGMVILHIEHGVPDFDRWKQTFDGFADARARGGVRRYRVLRSIDGGDVAVIDLAFDAEADARAFLEMLRGLWRRVDGTLITQPVARILSVVEEADVVGRR